MYEQYGNRIVADREDDPEDVATSAVEKLPDLDRELLVFRRDGAAGRWVRSVATFLIRPLYQRAATVGEEFAVFQRTMARISRSAVASMAIR
jgi:hypothetical protein